MGMFVCEYVCMSIYVVLSAAWMAGQIIIVGIIRFVVTVEVIIGIFLNDVRENNIAEK